MSHTQRATATYTDSNGQPVEGYTEVVVFDLPGVTVELVSAGPFYPGDEIVVRVTGTTDPDAAPGVASVAGATDNGDGTFTLIAA